MWRIEIVEPLANHFQIALLVREPGVVDAVLQVLLAFYCFMLIWVTIQIILRRLRTSIAAWRWTLLTFSFLTFLSAGIVSVLLSGFYGFIVHGGHTEKELVGLETRFLSELIELLFLWAFVGMTTCLRFLLLKAQSKTNP